MHPIEQELVDAHAFNMSLSAEIEALKKREASLKKLLEQSKSFITNDAVFLATVESALNVGKEGV